MHLLDFLTVVTIYLCTYKMNCIWRIAAALIHLSYVSFFREGRPLTPSLQISQSHFDSTNMSTSRSIQSFVQHQKNFRPLLVLLCVEPSSFVGTSLYTCQL